MNPRRRKIKRLGFSNTQMRTIGVLSLSGSMLRERNKLINTKR
jgi:hypothetical protein